MEKNKTNFPPVNPYKNDGYDDDNIPEIDLPQKNVEPLPESFRPRKDGPGGEEGE